MRCWVTMAMIRAGKLFKMLYQKSCKNINKKIVKTSTQSFAAKHHYLHFLEWNYVWIKKKLSFLLQYFVSLSNSKYFKATKIRSFKLVFTTFE